MNILIPSWLVPVLWLAAGIVSGVLGAYQFLPLI